eukprot:1161003-Pelagomonas_calceolata.AAC.13
MELCSHWHIQLQKKKRRIDTCVSVFRAYMDDCHRASAQVKTMQCSCAPQVTALSTSANKEAEAKSFGAKNFVVSSDPAAMKAMANTQGIKRQS